jgi:ribosomal protein L7/L12
VEMLKRRIPTLDIWFDLTGIESGDEFRDKIISAIKRSQYVLFALSINSDQSKWTRKELQFSSGKGKKIVPILLKGSKLEDMDWFLFEFGGVSYVDITDSKQIEQLIKNLASWTGKAIKTKRLAKAQPSSEKYENDSNTRIKKLEIAAKFGDGGAKIALAQIYENGEGVERDINKAIDCYRRAIVHHGHTEFVDDIRALIKEKESKAKEAKSLAEEKAIKKNHQLGTIIESIQSIKGNDNSTTFDIILKSAGKCKLQVVKIIKEQTGLGLKESKDIVDAAPSYITRNVDKVMAETIKKELEEVGASVEIR